MKNNGLDDFEKKLDLLAKNAAALDGEHNVPVNELLTPAFVAWHTQFASVDEFFEQSGFKIESLEDFAAIPDEEWDEYIRSVSGFSRWRAMLSKAGESWATEKMGL